MPTLDEIRQRKNVQLVDLPKEFVGTLISEELKQDRRQKECLYWEIALDGGGSFTQKISRGYYHLLEQSMHNLDVTSTKALVGKKMKWQQNTIQMQDANPRWFPVEIMN